jgi:hypothetical protein
MQGCTHKDPCAPSPRKTSPRASASVLPCSRVTQAASSSMCWLMSSWRRNMTRARAGAGVAAQAGKASRAAPTAALNSAGVQSGRRETTSWVAGFTTSTHSLDLDSTNSPLISSLTEGCGARRRPSAGQITSGRSRAWRAAGAQRINADRCGDYAGLTACCGTTSTVLASPRSAEITGPGCRRLEAAVRSAMVTLVSRVSSLVFVWFAAAVAGACCRSRGRQVSGFVSLTITAWNAVIAYLFTTEFIILDPRRAAR